MRLGRIAVLPDVKVQHHGIIGIGNCRRMSPGMLRVQQKIILRGSIQIGIFSGDFRIQPSAQPVTAPRVKIMLHGIRRASCPVCPPVRQITLKNRRILQMGPDSGIQLLQRNHAKPDFLTVTAVVFLNGT